MDPSAPSSVAQLSRPGCITAYALLLWIGGGLSLVGALCVGASTLLRGGAFERTVGVAGSSTLALTGLLASVGVGLGALLPIITGVGLWRMKNWAWWLVVVPQSLVLAFTVLGLCTNLTLPRASQSDVTVQIVSALVAGTVSGGILYWFITNRRLFTSAAGSKSSLAVVLVGVVAAVVVVPILVIAILALLGPAIANVFSGIATNI